MILEDPNRNRCKCHMLDCDFRDIVVRDSNDSTLINKKNITFE